MTQKKYSMSEKRTIIDKGVLVPLGVVMAIILPIMWIATIRAEVSANTKDIERIGTNVKEAPSRNEFQIIQEDIKEIKDDVKLLLSK